mmetsp:Transcript_120369/g.246013  ORF Transcript_120369/g.246013 Transcript_120369/m.246013 type:complete len:88 (+) Transcript_120369:140-403(+)
MAQIYCISCGQPRDRCLQHQTFLPADQAISRFWYAASQSKRADVVATWAAVSVAVGEHPLSKCAQQYCFFGSDHAACQLLKEASQSK